MKRTDRLNSLLKEVISEVITRDVRNPKVHTLITVTGVDVSKDLHNANVYISVIGSAEDKKQTLQALRSAAGFISVQASKKVVLRYFPHLTFHLDEGVDAHLQIDAVLQKIHDKEEHRKHQ
ncbi:MAG: 30S ribosome-binding factor RbfA [Verrucomicrobia bacterium]|nr:30S ribosome-binding factor RbfA [Verrucomicrobiota bacterium]